MLVQVATSLQASVRAEVDVLERVHLLLSDRSLLDRGPASLGKTVLQRLSHLLLLLAGVRDAWHAVFEAVPYVDDDVRYYPFFRLCSFLICLAACVVAWQCLLSVE